MVEHFSKVPDSWWRAACEVVSHPLACVGPNHRFVWCNYSYEKLVGYSRVELTGKPAGSGKTWQDITHMDDIGGDWESINSLEAGETTRYTLCKRYITKAGDTRPVILSVHRFPQELSDFVCFIAEAVEHSMSDDEMHALREDFEKTQEKVDSTLSALARRLTQIEKVNREGDVSHHNEEHNTTRISIGNTQTTWMVVMVLALLGVIGYVAYVSSWGPGGHGGDAVPPPAVEDLQ